MAVVRLSSYGDGQDLLTTIVDRMEAATERLWIKVPWWDTSPDGRRLLEATIAAHRRGADVKVLARPETSNDSVLRDLRNAGVEVVAIRYLHEKEILVDDAAISHSMNFTNKEITRNENSGHAYDDPQVVETTELGFASLLANRAAASLGDEEWTAASKLVPDELRKYLSLFERLNPLQSKAVPAVLTTAGHVMVVAPTSAGKTLIGEVAALRSIVLEKKPAVWLLPARALASEVGDTVQRWSEHGIRSVELTGETNMSSAAVRNAQLWVATTEKFESLYRRSSLRDFIATVGCIVIDEVHLVGDPARGATLESLIARLRVAEDRTRIVALSATVSNAEELSGWFNAQLVRSAWRPTVLTTQLVPYDEPDAYWEREAAKDSAVMSLLREIRTADAETSDDHEHSISSVFVFCGGKKAVRRTAAMIAGVDPGGEDDEALTEEAFSRGVGMHYRDAHRSQRALDAFKNRAITTLVATSGAATGVNTPARCVVIRDLEMGMSPLEVSLAQQMFGRAGRAGQEAEGFGFMLVPRHREAEWRAKLVDGYTANSQVLRQLGDALLAELLLGSVTDRAGAEAWIKETLAYAQSADELDIDDALDFLLLRGFAKESPDGLSVTELGALTSRLMIDVESAGALITALAEASVPDSADEAEESLIQILATEVASLRNWPINPKAYEDFVDEVLRPWTPRVLSRAGKDFGTRFCMAAAHLALRDTKRLQGRPPHGVSMPELKRAIEHMPRYLAWIAALGYTEQSTWAAAVAGELSRRLTWWHLRPTPERGTGRLLWLLERTLSPENHRTNMSGLWRRARQAGFSSPDRIRGIPNDTDITPEDFINLMRGGRAWLDIEPTSPVEIRLDARNNARVTAITNTGAQRAVVTSRPVAETLTLPVPRSHNSKEIAADIFLYTSVGDFAYQNLTADLPEQLVEEWTDPIEEARQLIELLPELTAVDARKRRIPVPKSGRRKIMELILPVMTPDESLRDVALVLAGREADPELAAINLRQNLRRLLATDASGPPRPAATVLRSGAATAMEMELTFVALAGSLQMEVGVATANERVCALVRVGDDWHLAMVSDMRNARITPLVPDKLPPIVGSLRDRPPVEQKPARPLCSWLTEFAPH